MEQSKDTSNDLPGWKLFDRYGDVLFLRATDAAKSGASWDEPFLVTEYELASWLADPLERGAVLDVYEELTGLSRWSWHGLPLAAYDDAVIRTIMRALDVGEMLALRVPPPPILSLVLEEPPEARKPQSSGDDWIGIRILDDAGNPLAGIKYRVKLPSGAIVKEDQVDAQGRARIDGLSPGQYTIECHELDGQSWNLKSG